MMMVRFPTTWPRSTLAIINCNHNDHHDHPDQHNLNPDHHHLHHHLNDDQVPHYLAAQYLGAFAASAAVFLVYWDALVWFVFILMIMIIFVIFLIYWDALVWSVDFVTVNTIIVIIIIPVMMMIINRYEHDRGAYRSIPDTAGIFGTFPSDHLSYAGIVISIVIFIIIVIHHHHQ